MTAPETTPRTRHRQGRITLLAVAVALTVIAVGAISSGFSTGNLDPGQAVPAPVTEPATTPSAAAPSATPQTSGNLTNGPLMPSSPPIRVTIPALTVATSVIDLGLQPDGTMQVPDGADTIGWYTGAPTPGSLGPAVLAGHVNWKKKPGVFAHLTRLKPGDLINVERRDGSMAMFAVTRVEQYAKDRFPSGTVYGPIDHAGLRLITCGGQFDSTAQSYRDNVVVYAVLKHAHAT